MQLKEYHYRVCFRFSPGSLCPGGIASVTANALSEGPSNTIGTYIHIHAVQCTYSQQFCDDLSVKKKYVSSGSKKRRKFFSKEMRQLFSFETLSIDFIAQ
jgi:hypothetical protein